MRKLQKISIITIIGINILGFGQSIFIKTHTPKFISQYKQEYQKSQNGKTSSTQPQNVTQNTTQNTTQKSQKSKKAVQLSAEDTSQSKHIELTADMIHDEGIAFYDTNYITRVDILVNEQNLIPDSPNEKPTKHPVGKNWVPTMQQPYVPIKAYIDLGRQYRITHIGYYDSNGIPTIQFFYGTPFKWQKILELPMDGYNGWAINVIDPITTQYLEIASPDSADSGIKEIALYGYPVGDAPNDNPVSTSQRTRDVPADKAIGVNGFVDDPIEVTKVAGMVREYHNREWDGPSDTKQMFSPSAAGGGTWDFDAYYQSLSDEGIDVVPCIQGNVNRMLGGNQKFSNFNDKPILSGADASDPKSYKIHASHMFQYAARYGFSNVSLSKLKLAAGQSKKTGLGLIKYYENYNEQNKTWLNKDAYFSPYEFAAMSSADYDGHEGTMGNDIGIKNADPNAKLVMGGLAGAVNSSYYLDLMKFWFKYNRKDGKFVPDVINIHEYSANQAPEKSGFKKKLQEATNRRDKNYPEKEVWLTEFGRDTHPQSENAAPNEETQGSWLMRGYLAAFAAGIDRITMYMIRDTASRNPLWYSTSGLVGEAGSWKPKASRYLIYTMKNILKNMVFDKVISEDSDIYTYKFKSFNGENKELYILRTPTQGDALIKNHRFNIGNYKKATLVTAKVGRIDGVKTELPINNNEVSFDVSQKPVFLILTSTQDTTIEPTINNIPITNITLDRVNTDSAFESTIEDQKKGFNHLIDEQNLVPESPYGLLEGKFTTQFDDVWPQRMFPIYAYIDLGKKYKVTNIGFYDSVGRGDINIYQGKPGDWNTTNPLKYDLYYYEKRVVKKVDFETRYLRIEKTNNGDLYELGVYGYPLE